MRRRPRLVRVFEDGRERLCSRRQVLLAAAGGSLALLFGLPLGVRAAESDGDWEVLDKVQQHLFPSEPFSPGASEINALAYLASVLRDDRIDQAERDFVLHGVFWMQDLARKRYQRGFLALDASSQAELLASIAESEAGENWLSTLLNYILEALLTAPAYGGNPAGIGWTWLRYQPGFPLPDARTLHWKLPT